MDPVKEEDHKRNELPSSWSVQQTTSPMTLAPSIELSRPGDRPTFLSTNQLDGPSYRPTPEISNDLDQQLQITSSDDTEDDEDSFGEPSESSVEDETTEAPPFGLPTAGLATGLCYDERMRFHSEVSAPSGEAVHPEDPRRIWYIFKELCDAGLVHDGSRKFRPLVPKPLKRINARMVEKSEVLLVHTLEHWKFLEQTAHMSNEALIELSDQKDQDSIYFNQFSAFSAKLSAGGAIETCKAVVNRDVKNAIAVIRPPGHHAEVHRAMGFCMFNNVCIASRVCQEDFGEDCRKILILDWDVHHGNGCQKAFYDNPNILYISIHVHMNGQFYPSGDEGDMWHVGEDRGTGFNVNVPWPTKGMGDGDYMYAFQNLVMPIATEFDPDLVIVAAGFDAAAGDELGGCFVSPPCYAHMTHMLMSLAGGKVAVCLEGGYNLSSISKSALAVTKTLMGEPPDRLIQTAATVSAVETVQQVRSIQSHYWRSIYPKEPVGGIWGETRFHDLIREWQAKVLHDEFRMTNLHIFRNDISKSFENQILASPAYHQQKRLFVCFHDAPEAMRSSTAISNEIKPHETWLVDPAKPLLTLAARSSFGLLDVNVPSHITDPKPPYRVIKYSATEDKVAQENGVRLGLYIWENYIEPYEFPDGIVLCGLGDSFNIVQQLLTQLDASRFIPEAPPPRSGLPVSSSDNEDASDANLKIDPHTHSHKSSHHSNHHHNNHDQSPLDKPIGGVRAVLGFIAAHPVRPVVLQLSTSTTSSTTPFPQPGTATHNSQNLFWGFTAPSSTAGEAGSTVIRPLTESTWYNATSRIYISPTHSFWSRFPEIVDHETGGMVDPSLWSPKVKKNLRRYGGVVNTTGVSLGEMVNEAVDEAWSWVGDRMGLDLDGESEESDDDDEDEVDDSGDDDDDRRDRGRGGRGGGGLDSNAGGDRSDDVVESMEGVEDTSGLSG